VGRGGGDESSSKERLGEHLGVWNSVSDVRTVQYMQKKVIPDHVECMQRMNVVTKGKVSENDWSMMMEMSNAGSTHLIQIPEVLQHLQIVAVHVPTQYLFRYHASCMNGSTRAATLFGREPDGAALDNLYEADYFPGK
jgi:hypothetical protein